jgi:hypothetical protein
VAAQVDAAYLRWHHAWRHHLAGHARLLRAHLGHLGHAIGPIGKSAHVGPHCHVWRHAGQHAGQAPGRPALWHLLLLLLLQPRSHAVLSCLHCCGSHLHRLLHACKAMQLRLHACYHHLQASLPSWVRQFRARSSATYSTAKEQFKDNKMEPPCMISMTSQFKEIVTHLSVQGWGHAALASGGL